jgi:hypothetical protein
MIVPWGNASGTALGHDNANKSETASLGFGHFARAKRDGDRGICFDAQ